jgi:hypothetical protein
MPQEQIRAPPRPSAEVCFLAAFALYLVSFGASGPMTRAHLFLDLPATSLVVGSAIFSAAPWSVESFLPAWFSRAAFGAV